ncbi:MAG TPA: 4Fe-4S dicluster domain-containing protein [Candidatus Bathyarchaeia archaeon]|nr:4Fe-4S dicluster domain-containing protein [Candidatus Bathyarchaeia archaeon]
MTLTRKIHGGSTIPILPGLPVALPPPTLFFGTPLVIARPSLGVPAPERTTGPEVARGELPKAAVNIFSELCKGCELCIYACPTGNISLSDGLNRKGYHPVTFSYHGKRGPCSACGLCYWVCPDLAIAEIGKLRQ